MRALTVLLSGSLLLGSVGVAPAFAEDYPTWDEVEAAKRNEAALAREVANIEGLLVGLELKAGALAREAQQQGERYAVAKEQLDTASARAQRLDERAADAADQAADSARRAGQLIAQAARTGGGDVSIALLFSADAGDLLSTLGTMGRLTEQSALVYKQAVSDRNAALALGDQARVAEEERQDLADQAQAALDAAQSASDSAQRTLAEQQAAAEQLYAQLASLKGTTAELERQYIAGLADQGGQTPGTPNNPGTPTNPNPTPTTPPGTNPGQPTPTPTPTPTTPPVVTPPPPPPPPPPTPSAAQGAIDFAYSQLGDPYVYGGYGPNGWDCSGLTKAAYASVGVYIGIHGSTSQYNYLASLGRLVSVNAMVPGDLVFYSDGGSTSGVKYHTAIYIGGGMMIEAPYEPLSVRVTPLRYYDLVPYAARPTG